MKSAQPPILRCLPEHHTLDQRRQECPVNETCRRAERQIESESSGSEYLRKGCKWKRKKERRSVPQPLLWGIWGYLVQNSRVWSYTHLARENGEASKVTLSRKESRLREHWESQKLLDRENESSLKVHSCFYNGNSDDHSDQKSKCKSRDG